MAPQAKGKLKQPGAIGPWSPVGKVTEYPCGCKTTVRPDHHRRLESCETHVFKPAPNPWLVAGKLQRDLDAIQSRMTEISEAMA